MTTLPASGPELSVLVPSYGRPDLVRQLLACFDEQTLDPARFEVVLVDDGSPDPVAIDADAHAFAITLVRQDNAGPAAARNAGIERCRAPLTLILNDDAVPTPRLFEQHLEAHARETERVAILGTFHFTERALRSPFTRVLAATDLLFDFPRLRDGELHDWTYFWTCNISIATDALRRVGGFDAERFDKAIVEDVELGYRLQAAGYRVRYLEALHCEHDHALSPAGYFRRAVDLGVYLSRMYEKHGDPAILWCAPGQDVDVEHLGAIQSTCEALQPSVDKLIAALEGFEERNADREIPRAEIDELTKLIRRLSYVPFGRGVLRQLEGHDPIDVIADGPKGGTTTSVIVVCHDAIDQTRRCLDALRAARDEDFPTELVFVDNGSSDGTPDFLAAQDDVRLIANDANLGAPRARNQGLAVATGDAVVFMDNDVVVTPGWLARLQYHAQVDARSGVIGCVSDRAAHNQQVDYGGDSTPATLAPFADARAAEFARQHRPQALMTSFLILARREVIERIGGFDERFSPWGFEDDDFTLRACLAGFRNRVALDVFVRHEPYQGTAKSRAHAGLLQRNWTRFAAKWSLPAGTAYGDYTALDAVPRETWTDDLLHAPIEGQAHAGDHLLAWPDYTDPDAVRGLIRDAAQRAEQGTGAGLVLRVSPKDDGRPDDVRRLVDEACAELDAAARAIELLWITDKNPKRAAERALQLCAAVHGDAASDRRERWLANTGLPRLED